MYKTTVNPVSDLRDYNKVLKNCEKGDPVILTKNGRSVFVVMTIDEYDELRELQNSRPKTLEQSCHMR